jgi:hypothetical protein
MHLVFALCNRGEWTPPPQIKYERNQQKRKILKTKEENLTSSALKESFFLTIYTVFTD